MSHRIYCAADFRLTGLRRGASGVAAIATMRDRLDCWERRIARFALCDDPLDAQIEALIAAAELAVAIADQNGAIILSDCDEAVGMATRLPGMVRPMGFRTASGAPIAHGMRWSRLNMMLSAATSPVKIVYERSISGVHWSFEARRLAEQAASGMEMNERREQGEGSRRATAPAMLPCDAMRSGRLH